MAASKKHSPYLYYTVLDLLSRIIRTSAETIP